MSQNVLANLEVQIDNITFKIVPNSGKFSDGKGEYTVSATAGGTVATAVVGLNLENALGMISFELYSTKDNIENINAIKIVSSTHTVRLTDPNSTFSRVMIGGTIVNEIEFNIGHDATFEVEFKGEPLTGS